MATTPARKQAGRQSQGNVPVPIAEPKPPPTSCRLRAPPPPPAAGKSGDEAKKNEIEAAALQRIMAALEQGKPARSVELNEEEAELGGWPWAALRAVCAAAARP